MKCDRCGRTFPSREAVTASRNEAVRSPGKRPYTEVVATILCPDCAASQRGLLWFMVAIVGGIVAAGVITGLLRFVAWA